MALDLYFQNITQWLLASGLKILLILGLAFAAVKLSRYVLHQFAAKAGKGKDEEVTKRIQTLSSVVRIAAMSSIVLIALLLIIQEFGIAIGPILAAAGVVGIAVGFGAQHLVQDVINGFFILLDDQIRVGDVVQIGDKSGVVEKVGLRLTILRDLSGNVHFIRNGQISQVTNMTKEYSRYLFDIGVAYREDVDEVIRVIQEVDENLRADPEFSGRILEPVEILGLDRFADSAVVIRARTKTKPVEQWKVGREFNRRLKKRFDELGIEIPFPHTTLYIGKDKEGRSPSLGVALEKEQNDSTVSDFDKGGPSAKSRCFRKK